jgi:hypothetical protein
MRIVKVLCICDKVTEICRYNEYHLAPVTPTTTPAALTPCGISISGTNSSSIASVLGIVAVQLLFRHNRECINPPSLESGGFAAGFRKRLLG